MKHLAIILFLFCGLSVGFFGSVQDHNRITGAFIQLDGQMARFGSEDWNKELERMQRIGIDTIIIQYSAYGDRFYYPSQYAQTEDSIPDESLFELVWTGTARTRYIKVRIDPTSVEWTMIAEVSVKSQEKTVSVGKPFFLSPDAHPQYPAGQKITDGRANYSWADMVGWQFPGKPIEIVIDLEEPVSIDSVEVTFMRSEISGVQVPEKGFELFFSNDGSAYLKAGRAELDRMDAGEIPDTLGMILENADQLNMNVFLGLSLNPSYWAGQFHPLEQARMNQQILTELFQRYQHHPSLAGWYLPEEIDDRTFLTQARKDAVISYLRSMSTYARMLTKKPVMLSPYFGINPDGKAYASWWDEVLSQAKVDIIAMQDGVGTKRTTVDESAAVMKALQPVMEKHGVRFWINVEVFDQIHGWPVDSRGWQAIPAEFSRVKEQLEKQSLYAEKTIIFDFPHYMTPRIGGKAETLYNEYQSYLQRLED